MSDRTFWTLVDRNNTPVGDGDFSRVGYGLASLVFTSDTDARAYRDRMAGYCRDNNRQNAADYWEGLGPVPLTEAEFD